MYNRRISIAIPTYERFDVLFESFADVYNDERIESIVIVDDCSSKSCFDRVHSRSLQYPKITLYRNNSNQDCYTNKMIAVSFAPTEWCILLDSDNKIDKSYIDKLYQIPIWEDDTIYTPDFARPHFNFTDYSNVLFSSENISEYIDRPMFQTMCNAANYFVNKNTYLKNWDNETNPVTSDSIYMVYRHLSFGGKVKVLKDLQYNHRVWNESHYQNKNHLTPKGFHEKILQSLREMK